MELDGRFSAPEWAESPYFDYIRHAYQINAAFLSKLVDAVPVPDARSKRKLRYLTRQFVDAMAPSNFAATNPEFIRLTLESRGQNITDGIRNLLSDLANGHVSMTDESAFAVGKNLATAPGTVVFQNELFQLIQYAPTTETVAERPYLIIPPCINKFYILDLRENNSFVRYMVAQGHSVFMVSWRNPGQEQGRLRWDDYLESGVLTALRVVGEISGREQANVLGFCIGGTLLCSALAVAAARGEQPAASLTLFATLLDFSDAGEIGSLVDENSVAAREETIGQGGLLHGRELVTTFASLRANDLVWRYVVGNYMKGQKPPPFDILYWNSDSTNIPGPFLVYYLRNMYLENRLREVGQLSFCGESCDLSRIDTPIYLLATQEDHIVPWRSAYLSRSILRGHTTFVLGASGHIAGVINPPVGNKRCYWTNDSAAGDAEEWFAGASRQVGSWWPHYSDWLAAHRGGERAAPRGPGTDRYPALEEAPGSYVQVRV